MNKDIKNFKLFIGIFILLTMFVSVSASAAMDFGPATLKVGSKGEYVKTLQNLVGASPADGIFGKGTKTKVMAWQESNGLTADGIFGAKSMAKANLGASIGTTPTVALCPNGMTLASNCMTAPSNGGVVSGGAGNLSSATLMGSPSNVQAGESSMNTKVLGFQLRADSGSSLGIQNVRVNLVATGVGSTWPSRYIQGISVWQGANKVGSASVSQLSQNGTTYNATIALTGAVVAANTTSDFFVAVDVNTTIDTGDANNTFNVYVDSIRYVDGTGAILTSSYANTVLTQPMRFLKLSASAAVKLILSEEVDNPKPRTVTTNYTSFTTDVSLLKFKLKAEGSDLSVGSIALPLEATGVVDASQIASYYKLKYDGRVISSFTLTDTGLTPTITFGDDTVAGSTLLDGAVASVNIVAGGTALLEVVADVKPLCNGVSIVSPCTATTGTEFDAGDTLKVDFPSSTLQSSDVSVENQVGDNLSTSSTNRLGSATGYTATFRVQGINSTYVSSAFTPTKDTSGILKAENYLTTVQVSAVGADYFINPIANFVNNTALSTTQDGAANTAFGFNVAVLNSSNQYVTTTEVPNASAALSVTCTVGCIQQSISSMKIPAGTTATFVISTTLSDPAAAPSGIAAGGYKVAVFSTNATDGTTLSAFPNTPAYSFITPVSPDIFL